MDKSETWNDRCNSVVEAAADLTRRMADDADLMSAYLVEEQFQNGWKNLEEVADAISTDKFPDQIEWSDMMLSRDEALARFEAIFDALSYIQAYLCQHAKDGFDRVRSGENK